MTKNGDSIAKNPSNRFWESTMDFEQDYEFDNYSL